LSFQIEEILLKTIFLITIAILSTSIALSQTSSAPAKKPATPATTKSAPAPTGKQPSMEELNGFMRHMFGYDPMVKWKIESVKPSEVAGVTEVIITFGEPVQQRTPFYVASDLQHAFIGQIIPFGSDPFQPARQKLAAEAKGPVKGVADAPVEIVEFSDFQCPHCKRAWPKVEQLMSQSPNARLVFQNFPLSNIHKWADRAAGYADCIARKNPDQFWKFAQEVFDQQENITDQNAVERLNTIATDAGADATGTATCADLADTKARVNQQYQLGASLGVTGTPTLFLNGRKIENVNDTPIEIMKQMVDFEAQENAKKVAEAH
jgi:protein-disulfide isomerase